MFNYGYASINNEIAELDTQYARYSRSSITLVNQELIETVDLFTWVIRLNRVYGSNIRSARFVCTAQPPPGSPLENIISNVPVNRDSYTFIVSFTEAMKRAKLL